MAIFGSDKGKATMSENEYQKHLRDKEIERVSKPNSRDDDNRPEVKRGITRVSTPPLAGRDPNPVRRNAGLSFPDLAEEPRRDNVRRTSSPPLARGNKGAGVSYPDLAQDSFWGKASRTIKEKGTPLARSIGGTIKTQAINWGNRINDTHERNEGSRGNRRRGERRESSHFNIDTGGMLNPNFNRDTGSPFGSGSGMFHMQNPFEQKEPKAKKPKQPSGNQTIRIVHEYPGSPPPRRKGKKSTRSSMAMNRYDPFAVPKSLKKFF